MLETDFILMMTTGFLLAPESAKQKMLTDFEVPYELSVPRAPGRVSIGALGAVGPLPFKKWIDIVRAGNLVSVSVVYVPYERPGLATHIAAAFAGVVSYILEAETGKGKQTWYLQAENSLRSSITAAQFADFVESQPDKAVLWNRLHFLINESNSLNNRPLVPRGGTRAWLKTPAGESVFDSLGDNLLSEMQIEAEIRGISIVFSPEWNTYFIPPGERSPFYASGTGKEPVYFYLLRRVTADELKRIIAAQPFADKILPALRQLINKEPSHGLNGIDDAETLLQRGTNDQLQTLGSLVCQVIREYCEENELLPVLPPSLAAVFGPDETDQRRARARGHTEKFLLLKPAGNPWRYYQFIPLADVELPRQDQTREDIDLGFRSSLDAIYRFAEKQRLSFYAGIFKLAALVVSPEVMERSFTAENITGLIKEHGLPEELRQTLTDSIYYVSGMQSLEWPMPGCFGLLAVSLTNVFGGMGSWNDMSFEEDADMYNRVSADFFLARELFFSSQLSGTNNRPAG